MNVPDPLKHLSGFRRIELQIGLADFHGLAAGLHRDQGKRRIATGHDDQVEAAGRMLQQPVQHIVDIRIGHQVVIIEHQQERLADLLQIVGKELREDVRRRATGQHPADRGSGRRPSIRGVAPPPRHS